MTDVEISYPFKILISATVLKRIGQQWGQSHFSGSQDSRGLRHAIDQAPQMATGQKQVYITQEQHRLLYNDAEMWLTDLRFQRRDGRQGEVRAARAWLRNLGRP